MTRRLLLTYLSITALALALLAVPFGVTFAHRERERVLAGIERDADSIATVVERQTSAGALFTRADVTAYAKRTGGHVIVVSTRGIGLLDTQYPNEQRDYSTRPEIVAALQGRRVDGTRRSETLGTSLLFAAVPTTGNGRITGAVRVTYPSATLDSRVRQTWARITLLCAAVLVVVALVGFALARSVTRPVRRLEDASDRLADVDLSARVDTATGPKELRHLATTFNRMADRLAELVGAQERFVADASHQLRTPLTALRLRLENLEARAAPGDRAALEAATAEVARMSRLIDGLLALARSAAEQPAITPVDIAQATRERVDIWRDLLAEQHVDVSIDALESAVVLTLPGALEQIVDNLLDNASIVAPAGSTIEVRVVPSKNRVELHVLDRGPGLDEDHRSHAFERFWRAQDAPPGGTGLGLAVVRQLAEAGGGSARLDARAGGGIDAVVVFPATNEAAGETRARASFSSR